MLSFIRKSAYIALSLHCLKEQKRAQDAEYQVQKLLDDNETLGRLVAFYKAKSDRLEYAVHHPRGLRGKFEKVELTK